MLQAKGDVLSTFFYRVGGTFHGRLKFDSSPGITGLSPQSFQASPGSSRSWPWKSQPQIDPEPGDVLNGGKKHNDSDLICFCKEEVLRCVWAYA